MKVIKVKEEKAEIYMGHSCACAGREEQRITSDISVGLPFFRSSVIE